MSKKTVFIVLECSLDGNSALVFDSEEAKKECIREILERYEKHYGKPLKTIDALYQQSNGNVWVDLYETFLKQGE